MRWFANAEAPATTASAHLETWHFVGFGVVVFCLLMLDLFVLNKKHEVPTVKKSALQTLMWIGIGLSMLIWLPLMGFDSTAVQQYAAGYAIEWSLSVDNVFVWSLVLMFFAVPRQYQHTVLFWGIFGALIMRFTFIFAGIQVIERFAIAIVILGLFLIWSGLKLFKSDDDDMDVSQMRSYRIITKVIPTTKEMHGAALFVRVGTRVFATPLFICLSTIEAVDVLFATDSVPAILAISHDPFIVFSSNAMAIMGLRSLYFLFDSIKDNFSRLNEGLAIILSAVGIKMIISSDMEVFGLFRLPGYHIPTGLSLGFIITVLIGSVVASKLFPEKERDNDEQGPTALAA